MTLRPSGKYSVSRLAWHGFVLAGGLSCAMLFAGTPSQAQEAAQDLPPSDDLTMEEVVAPVSDVPAMPAAPAVMLDIPNAYQVNNVSVDVTARTAAIARELAVRNGQRKALDILLRRLTTEEDRQAIPMLDDRGVESLVLSIEFMNERYSPTRYMADLVIVFNQDGVRNLLEISGSSFSETMSRPVLVLPYHQNAGLTTAWTEDNAWLEIWREIDWRTSLVPFMFPGSDDAYALAGLGMGDDENFDTIAPEMAAQYGVGETLIVRANDSINFLTGQLQLQVLTIRAGGGLEVRSDHIFTPIDGEDDVDFFTRVATTIGEDVAGAWKEQTLVSMDQLGSMRAQMYLSSLQEWIELKKRLEKVPLIREMALHSISINEVQLDLIYLGTPAQLSATLQQYGISLTEFDQQWTLHFQ